MNIILTSVHIEKSPQAVPLAPMLIKGYVDKYGLDASFNVDVKEFILNDSITDVVNKIIHSGAGVLGCSIYLWNRSFYSSLIIAVKKALPNIIIVAGGADVRSTSDKLMNIGVDYVIQGEGESAFLELLLHIRDGISAEIPGVNNNKNNYIKDLDTIPSAILTGNLALKKYDGYLWELSRGCPFSCDFCFESRGAKGVRYYSFERIEAELDLIINNKVPQVFVLDPTFNVNKDRATKILNLIKKKNKGTHFHFEVRAELLTKDLARLFSEIECSLQIGIQSSNKEVLKLVNRDIDKDLFQNKISILNKYSVVFGLDLIFGLPGDSYSSFKESMEFVLTLQPNHLDIFPLAVLPGTQLKDNAESLELNYLVEPPYTIINTPTYSKVDMVDSYKLKEACDFIYNRGKATGWLLQVCSELEVSCTDFIEDFILFSEEIDTISLGNENIVIIDYIKKTFKDGNKNVISDIINYHFNYSKALLSKKEKSKIKSNKLLTSKPILSTGTAIVVNKYDILTAFENSCYFIDDIIGNFKPNKFRVVSWYHIGGEVIFDSYENSIMNFLERCNGNERSIDIDKKIDLNFLIFAQDSGLLIFK